MIKSNCIITVWFHFMKHISHTFAIKWATDTCCLFGVSKIADSWCKTEGGQEFAKNLIWRFVILCPCASAQRGSHYLTKSAGNQERTMTPALPGTSLGSRGWPAGHGGASWPPRAHHTGNQTKLYFRN